MESLINRPNDASQIKPKDEICQPQSKTTRFYVRSLGWVKISEENLTPERSSRAVNKCINDLSKGTKGFDDVVARWGDV